ncbi:MAG: serine/threonine protein phosphatase [Bryobacteraceae bacterium]
MGHFHGIAGSTHVRRLAWLALLGPLFFSSYNLANSLAAARGAAVPSIVFDWERYVPFLALSIVPYWSSDLLYAASFLTCRTKTEIDRHGLRLLSIQVISVLIFVLFPLKVTFPRPILDGFFGFLFDILHSFDQPYNQAPSLHVSLAYILWRQFRGPVFGIWFLLIGVSAITTYQHHFIDLPTGLWAGVLVVALLPETSRPECRRRELALCYALGSLAFTVTGFSWAWVLLWPAFSLSLVAAAYWTGNVETLGKRSGRMPFWMWPYCLGAWVNARLWSNEQTEIANGVMIGRVPLGRERMAFGSIVDLTGELPLRADAHVPMLDLAIPSCEQISAAVAAIFSLEDRRPTLVCCALGYSRSAAAVAAWLYASGAASSIKGAIGIVRMARPQVVLSPAMERRLAQWAGRSSCKL